MAELPIVDAHHHLWDLSRNFYPWLSPRPLPPSMAGDVTPIARNYLVGDYLADTKSQSLVKSVHVEAGFDPAQPVKESEWLQGIAHPKGFPHAIVAKCELHAPRVEAILEAHSGFPKVRGIRHMINWHADPSKTYTGEEFLKNARWREGYARLRKHGFSFDLQIYPAQMNEAALLVGQHPDIPVILDHAGMPVDRDPASIELWRTGMAALAEIPHVFVKISGLGMVDKNWTVDSIRPFVLTIIEAFGPRRSMFASNFPVDKLYGSFESLFGAFREITRDFSPDERRELFAGTAERAYRI